MTIGFSLVNEDREVNGDLLGLEDWNFVGNMLELFEGNKLAEADSDMFFHTAHQQILLGQLDRLEGTFLRLLDGNRLGETNINTLGDAEGDVDRDLLGTAIVL